MIRFEQKDSSEPIWVPEDSVVLSNEKWVEKNFPVKHRYNMYIVTADNVLEPAVIKQVSYTLRPQLQLGFAKICINSEC